MLSREDLRSRQEGSVEPTTKVAQSARPSLCASTASSTASLVPHSHASSSSRLRVPTIKRAFASSFRNKSLKYFEGRYRMRALVLITLCVMLLAVLQAGYVVVDAKREKRVNKSQVHALVSHSESSTGPHSQEGPGEVKDDTTNPSSRIDGDLSGEHSKTYKSTDRGSHSHHHHHHKKGHHDNRLTMSTNRRKVKPDKSPKPLIHFDPKESRPHETTSAAFSQEGEPLQVHISVERITHHAENNSPKDQKPTVDPHDVMINDVPKLTTGAPQDPGEHERKHGGPHQSGHNRVLNARTCTDDSDCAAGDCCLQTRSGHRTCKKGGYKTSGRHCTSSCVCRQGFECVIKPDRKTSKPDTHTFGRCKPHSL